MSITDTIFENQQVSEYMEKQLHNNWAGTPFEDYPRLDPKQKGGFGELYVETLMRILGHTVESPTNPGHDRIIDGIKTEIKFSLAGSNRKKDEKLIDPDSFTFNHIAMEKDWERFIFLGINPPIDSENTRSFDKSSWPIHRLYIMEKTSFVTHMNSGSKIFKHQQGGNKSKNDDYCVFGRNSFYQLINLPFIREISMEVPNAK